MLSGLVVRRQWPKRMGCTQTIRPRGTVSRRGRARKCPRGAAASQKDVGGACGTRAAREAQDPPRPPLEPVRVRAPQRHEGLRHSTHEDCEGQGQLRAGQGLVLSRTAHLQLGSQLLLSNHLQLSGAYAESEQARTYETRPAGGQVQRLPDAVQAAGGHPAWSEHQRPPQRSHGARSGGPGCDASCDAPL